MQLSLDKRFKLMIWSQNLHRIFPLHIVYNDKNQLSERLKQTNPVHNQIEPTKGKTPRERKWVKVPEKRNERKFKGKDGWSCSWVSEKETAPCRKKERRRHQNCGCWGSWFVLLLELSSHGNFSLSECNTQWS